MQRRGFFSACFLFFLASVAVTLNWGPVICKLPVTLQYNDILKRVTENVRLCVHITAKFPKYRSKKNPYAFHI